MIDACIHQWVLLYFFKSVEKIEFGTIPDTTTESTKSTPEHHLARSSKQKQEKHQSNMKTKVTTSQIGKHHDLWEGLQDDAFRKKHNAKAPLPPNRELKLGFHLMDLHG
jgi:hypothetical protein